MLSTKSSSTLSSSRRIKWFDLIWFHRHSKQRKASKNIQSNPHNGSELQIMVLSTKGSRNQILKRNFCFTYVYARSLEPRHSSFVPLFIIFMFIALHLRKTKIIITRLGNRQRSMGSKNQEMALFWNFFLQFNGVWSLMTVWGMLWNFCHWSLT